MSSSHSNSVLNLLSLQECSGHAKHTSISVPKSFWVVTMSPCLCIVTEHLIKNMYIYNCKLQSVQFPTDYKLDTWLQRIWMPYPSWSQVSIIRNLLLPSTWFHHKLAIIQRTVPNIENQKGKASAQTNGGLRLSGDHKKQWPYRTNRPW